MNIQEIQQISEKIQEIAATIQNAKSQLEIIKQEFSEGMNVSIAIEDAAYLSFSKEEVVLFLANQIGILETKLQEMGEQLSTLLQN